MKDENMLRFRKIVSHSFSVNPEIINCTKVKRTICNANYFLLHLQLLNLPETAHAPHKQLQVELLRA